MLSSFAAVMTFGCRPPVSHGLAANAALAAGRQPRLRSMCQPPLLVYTCTVKEGAFGEKNVFLAFSFQFCIWSSRDSEKLIRAER